MSISIFIPITRDKSETALLCYIVVYIEVRDIVSNGNDVRSDYQGNELENTGILIILFLIYIYTMFPLARLKYAKIM